MSALEYTCWQTHLAQYPPGDYLQHGLIAKLCCLVSDIFKKKEQPPSKIFDFAPWLEDPKARRQREEKAQAEGRRVKAARLKSAYRRQREQQQETEVVDG